MISELLYSSIIYTTPLLLAAIGGYFSEKAGVTNIALEGKMLLGAFFSIVGVKISGSLLIGILLGIIAGALTGLLHGLLTQVLFSDDIISGMAINILGLGITGYGLLKILGSSGASESYQTITLRPFGIPILYIVALITTVAVHFWSKFTTSGLRHRAVGESLITAKAAGLKISRIRIFGTVVAGIFAALGGIQLSLGELGVFVSRMTAGNGFIALGVLILARWKPLPLILTSFFFGFVKALTQNIEFYIPDLPSDIILMSPFVLVILVLSISGGKISAPASLGNKLTNSLPYP
jgi:general nucleoside transport system permease protein